LSSSNAALPSLKIIAWNIARRAEAWLRLLDCDVDIALLQEAAEPPPDVAARLDIDPAPWRTAGGGINRPWRTAVVRLSREAEVEWIEPKALEHAGPGELAVSRLGTLSVAIATPRVGKSFVVASMYATWEKPHSSTGGRWIYADGSVHRLISDLSTTVAAPSARRPWTSAPGVRSSRRVMWGEGSLAISLRMDDSGVAGRSVPADALCQRNLWWATDNGRPAGHRQLRTLYVTGDAEDAQTTRSRSPHRVLSWRDSTPLARRCGRELSRPATMCVHVCDGAPETVSERSCR
jgi:hypothetical protein